MSSVELDQGLPHVFSSHMLNGKTLAGAVSTTMTPARPIPGALDVVSHMISRVMTAYAPSFFEPTSTAVGHLTDGADAVLQSNTAYHGTDTTGGTHVAARDHFQAH